MATTKSINGTSFSIPAKSEEGWATNVSNYLIAISDYCLQTDGGTRTLLAELNLGATYGVKQAYLKSQATNPASAGIIRLGNTESVAWRNAANGADKALKVNASDQLEFDGTPILALAAGAANTVLRMNSGGTAYEWSKISSDNVDSSIATIAGTQDLTNKTFTDAATLQEQGSTPSTPSAGDLKVYARQDNGLGVLAVLDDDGFVGELMRDNFLIGKNTTGSTITKGSAVYINGASGGFFTIALARADSSSTMPALGVAAADITDTSFGRILLVGDIASIDTSAFTAGDVLYVSATTAGALVATRPAHPHITQRIGTVLVSGVGNGQLEVNTRELDGDSLGTRQDTFLIGSGDAASSSLSFYNSSGFTADLVSAHSNSVTITLPAATDTLVGKATTDILTNKTLTSPKINEDVALTATATELNILDGATLSTTELNYVDGVTSAIQTQLDAINKLTTKADILVHNGTIYARHAVGADGTVLTADSAQATGLTWSSPLTNPMTTVGDIIVGGASGAATRLAIGTTGTVLKSDGTDPEWGAIVNANVDASAAIDGSKLQAATGSNAGVVTTAAQTFAGAKTFSGGIVGVTDASSATAGNIGEYVESIQSAGQTHSTTNTYKAITSGLTLTAGDWDISAWAILRKTGSTLTATSDAFLAISTTSGANTGSTFGHDRVAVSQDAMGSGEYIMLQIPLKRVSISSGATYYLNGLCVYSAGTPTWYGTINARRVR